MFTIKYVSQKTGLTTHAIRVWERRYGVIRPIRTGTNRRLYSEEDVKKLTLLKKATMAGLPIGQLIHLTNDELEHIVDDYHPTSRSEAPNASVRTESSASSFVEAALAAAKTFDITALEDVLDQASIDLSQPDLIDQVIIPFLHQVGESWFNGELRVAQEHSASEVVRRFLSRQLSRAGLPEERAPLLLTATVSGLHHEFGAMLAAVAAASQGWKAEYIGPNLPAEEIVFAAIQKHARAVAISVVYPPADHLVSEQLVRLSQLLPESLHLFVSGRSADSYRESLTGMRITFLKNMAELRENLLRLR